MIKTIVDLIVQVAGLEENFLLDVIDFIGTPAVAMLLSLLLAFYTMGIARKLPIESVMKSCSSAAAGIGLMVLIIGGGAFKQVLIDGGVGEYIAQLFSDTKISPLILAWVVAAILRLSLGSATVAAISTAGLVIPLLAASDVNLALVTIATDAGSSIASHVNDAGFWMVKEYFFCWINSKRNVWNVDAAFNCRFSRRLSKVLLLSLVV